MTAWTLDPGNQGFPQPMAATVSRLRTPQDRAKEAKADQLRALLSEARGLLPEPLETKVIASLDQQSPSVSGWSFVMVSPTQNRAVIRWLSANSRSPIHAMEIWAELLANMRRDTGEVALTRDELAEAIGISADEVSRTMTELETCGAISRLRQKVPGMRGPGVVRYFVSPLVATTTTGSQRDKVQAKAPKAPTLRLVSGT